MRGLTPGCTSRKVEGGVRSGMCTAKVECGVRSKVCTRSVYWLARQDFSLDEFCDRRARAVETVDTVLSAPHRTRENELSLIDRQPANEPAHALSRRDRRRTRL